MRTPTGLKRNGDLGLSGAAPAHPWFGEALARTAQTPYVRGLTLLQGVRIMRADLEALASDIERSTGLLRRRL